MEAHGRRHPGRVGVRTPRRGRSDRTRSPRHLTALGAMSSTAPDMDNHHATDLARVLVTRLSEVRHFGADGEKAPLLLDDPFVELEPGLKPSLLELLGHGASSPQLIFLT